MGYSLLVANDGGHITELSLLAARLELLGTPLWATVPTPQTESMLAGQEVHWMAPAATRDLRAAAVNAWRIGRSRRRRAIVEAISTGSSTAVSALPQMALRRIPTHYIESVTRLEGLSFSGRLLNRCPGVRIYVQWPELASRRWQYRGSVFDGYQSEMAEPKAIRRVVVTVGTSSTFGFRRLIEHVLEIIPADVDVLWQTGSTDVTDLAIDARRAVPNEELKAAIEAADAVIAHAGAGISLTILGLGKVPLLVPRSAAHREHVDDHQREIGSALAKEGLAIVAEAEDLDWETVTRSAGLRAVQSAAPLPFRLHRDA